MKKILLFALLVMTVLTGCANRNGAKIRGHNNSHNVIVNGDAISVGGKGTVIGSGRFVTKDIAVGTFSYIQLSGTPNVNFTQKSGSPSVTVRAEDNIIDLLDIGVRGNSLYIGFKSNVSVSCKGVTVDVSGESLSGVSVSGSGNVSVSGGLKTNDLDVSIAGSGKINIQNVTSGQTSVSISGSGNVSLSGSTNSARYSITGSGNIRAQNFIAKNVDARTSGSGSIDCYASDNIKTSSAGSGRIRYSGNPRVNYI